MNTADSQPVGKSNADNAASYPATGTLAAPFAGTVLIRNVKPYGETDGVNIVIEDGVITDVDAASDTQADRVIEGKGAVLLPGLVDIHVHLREPGREDTETIATGSAAAAAGTASGSGMNGRSAVSFSADSVSLFSAGAVLALGLRPRRFGAAGCEVSLPASPAGRSSVISSMFSLP